jgi:hypothetical protein
MEAHIEMILMTGGSCNESKSENFVSDGEFHPKAIYPSLKNFPSGIGG